MDPVTVAMPAGLLATGWLIGRHARLKHPPKPVQPICLCGHHYGTHDLRNGECRQQKKVRVNLVDE